MRDWGGLASVNQRMELWMQSTDHAVSMLEQYCASVAEQDHEGQKQALRGQLSMLKSKLQESQEQHNTLLQIRQHQARRGDPNAARLVSPEAQDPLDEIAAMAREGIRSSDEVLPAHTPGRRDTDALLRSRGVRGATPPTNAIFGNNAAGSILDERLRMEDSRIATGEAPNSDMSKLMLKMRRDKLSDKLREKIAGAGA